MSLPRSASNTQRAMERPATIRPLMPGVISIVVLLAIIRRCDNFAHWTCEVPAVSP